MGDVPTNIARPPARGNLRGRGTDSRCPPRRLGYDRRVADIFTPAKRSAVMSRIRSRDNARTEGALVRVFRGLGITGWRRQVRLRVGAGGRPVTAAFGVRPDFVFAHRRLAVFVDGCFWHGCPEHGTRPAGNAAFWSAKLASNAARDARVNRGLRRAGWRVLRIWEHELVRSREARLVRRLRRWFPVEPPGAAAGRG